MLTRKQQQLKKRLLVHLEKRGRESNFKITEGLIRYWWKILNDLVFDSRLIPPVEIRVGSLKNVDGYCTYQNHKAQIIIAIDHNIYTRKIFLTALVHEMVHAFNYLYVPDVDKWGDHGKPFMKWKSKIKSRTGLILERLVPLDDEDD